MFTRTLEPLKPLSSTKPQHNRIMTMGFGSRSSRPWPTLNHDHRQSPAYFMYPVNKVSMEYLDKLVVIIIWWPTCLPKDGRRAVQLVKEHLKTAMPRRKNYTNHHRQGVNFLIEDQVYLQATSLKGTKHFHVKGKLTPRFNNPPEIATRWKRRQLLAGVTT